MGKKGKAYFERRGYTVVDSKMDVPPAGYAALADELAARLVAEMGTHSFSKVYLAYNESKSVLTQKPSFEQLLPLSGDRMRAPEGSWDYIYEPDAKVVLDQVLTRYIEAIIFQAVAENMASEQSARMVAMKSASDNAKKVIGVGVKNSTADLFISNCDEFLYYDDLVRVAPPKPRARFGNWWRKSAPDFITSPGQKNYHVCKSGNCSCRTGRKSKRKSNPVPRKISPARRAHWTPRWIFPKCIKSCRVPCPAFVIG